jgi:hypothetical protein
MLLDDSGTKMYLPAIKPMIHSASVLSSIARITPLFEKVRESLHGCELGAVFGPYIPLI